LRFKDVASGWGVAVVSYQEIAKAMEDDDGQFFKGEGLGPFEPERECLSPYR
jgi:hypothetical protein